MIVLKRTPLLAALVFALLVRPALADGARERDGLFLRLGLGGAGLGMDRTGHVGVGTQPAWYAGESRIAGGAAASELTIGGTFSNGIVLAGSLLGHQIGDPTLERDGGSDLGLEGPLQFSAVGITVAYFPRSTGGFHVGGTAALAAAWAKAPPPRFTEYIGGAGGAIAVEAGYLWWVADQWSLGALVRLTGARLHGEDTQLGVTGSEDDTVRALSIVFQAVYN